MRARLTSYFPSIPALALYLATLVSEVPVIFMRMLLTIAVAAIVLLLKEGSAGGAMGYAELALIPTGWAIFALLTPVGGGWWWRSNMGGREPSEREQSAYEAALEELREQADTPLQEPSGWFVLDTPEPDAAVCGNTLALSRGLFETSYLPAVLAHELGHLNTSDGRLTAALNRLLLNSPPRLKEEEQEHVERSVELSGGGRILLTVTLIGLFLWVVRKAFVFARGGLGLRITAPFWGSYWREREHLADSFAAALGQGDELADFLEIHALVHDHPVPFIWLTEHTHPPTELRVDRLRRAAGARGYRVAEAPEPVKAAPSGPPAGGPDGPALTEPGPSAVDLPGRQG